MSKNDKVATVSANTGLALPFDYGADAGAGMDVTMDDLRIPMAVLAQTESKVLIEGEAKYIAGGKPGDILNSATKEYIPGDVGILGIPSSIKTSVIEWLPDNQGFVAEHAIDSDIAKNARANGNKTENGNDLVKTKTMVLTLVDDNLVPTGFIVVPFSSSKLAAWSDYFTKIDTAKATRNAPIFANLIRIVSFDDKNRDGKRYKNYAMFPALNEAGALLSTKGLTAKAAVADVAAQGSVVKSLLDPTSAGVLAAKQLREQLLSGVAQIDRESSAEAAEAEGGRHF